MPATKPNAVSVHPSIARFLHEQSSTRSAAPVPNSHWHGTSRTLAPIENIKAPESETRQLQKRTELRVSMGKRRFGIERFAWDEADQLQQ